MKRVKIILSVFILIFLLSCSSKKRIYVYSPNKKQCITIITEYNYRYIIEGKHYNVPDTNYVKVDLSQMDKIGDGIAGCWENNRYKWIIINDQTKIIENKLDTLKYKFITNFPKDEQQIPTLKDYIGNGCYNFDFEVFSIVPKDGAIIQRK